jgi:hypothetical protein
MAAQPDVEPPDVESPMMAIAKQNHEWVLEQCSDEAKAIIEENAPSQSLTGLWITWYRLHRHRLDFNAFIIEMCAATAAALAAVKEHVTETRGLEDVFYTTRSAREIVEQELNTALDTAMVAALAPH